METNALQQDLGGDWQFQRAEGPRPGRGWRPARVPGNILTDLMAAGLLADPLAGDQEADAGWVESTDWWYRRVFTADPALVAAPRARLLAEGLDTWCSLWLNGERLGRAQNMFVEHAFEVGGRLRRGRNELLLRFEAPARVLPRLERRYGKRAAVGDSLRTQARKAQYGFGWDWGPRLPGAGVFKPIRLRGMGPVDIEDLWCRTLKAGSGRASGLLVAELSSDRARSLPLRADLGPWHFEGTVALKKGLNTLRLPWVLERPRLWWPRGHGDAALYRAELSVAGSARASVAVGIRTVDLDRRPDGAGSAFGFKVNGRPIYAKGANWIPADSFLGRLDDARVESLVAQAASANMTMLRVWGGGLYESEAFYRACDRAGLLVWQDFPFACAEVSEHPELKAQVRREAGLALRRLRRHPSLALWCGNNEVQWGRECGWFRGREAKRWGRAYFERMLPALCARLDPDRPYHPGSPWGGPEANSPDHGDRHQWEVWARFLDPTHFLGDRGRFISEFGFAALPNAPALARALGPGERWAQSRGMDFHDKVDLGGAGARIAFYIHRHLPMAPGLERFRYLSQVNQAAALRAGFEHWRRLKPRNQGALVWQLNDCWPAVSWSLLDADDSPKLAWFAVRGALDDVLLSSVEAGAKRHPEGPGALPLRAADEGGICEAWVSLDGPARARARLRVERWDMAGRRALLDERPVVLAAGASRRCWARPRRDCGVSDPAREFLVFCLDLAGGSSRRSLLFFDRPKRLELPADTLRITARAGSAGMELTLRSRGLALACEVAAPVPGRFSDNGFDLLPGEARRVLFVPARPGPVHGAWRAQTLNQAQTEARRP